MEKVLKINAEDEVELVNCCKTVWKDQKNKGLRSVQKLTKMIIISFKYEKKI